MIVEDVRPVLDTLAAFNLLSLGYEYSQTIEQNMGLNRLRKVRFENRLLKSSLDFVFWVPELEDGRSSGSNSRYSLSPSITTGKKRASREMDLYRYSRERGLPLANVAFRKEGQTLDDFTDDFLDEFGRAAETYLREFLLDKAWEDQVDPRDA